MFDTFQEEVLCNDLVVCHMNQKETPLVVVCHKDLLQDARATMKNINKSKTLTNLFTS